MPLFAALTIDVDPDANVAVQGRPDAVSAGSSIPEARANATAEGLQFLAEVLLTMQAPATLFWEARTLQRLAEDYPGLLTAMRNSSLLEHGTHGLRHEDFAGKESGKPLGPEETHRVMVKAGTAFQSMWGRRPAGFRAPYCRLTNDLISTLCAQRYRYDASLTRRPGREWNLRPFELRRGIGGQVLWETALCRCLDAAGKPITGYLWQFFEGRRRLDEYLEVIYLLAEGHPGGLFQIALHPWHLVASSSGKRFPTEHRKYATSGVRRLVRTLGDLENIRLTTISHYLDGCAARAASER